jgi:uncharacterized protein (TIGR02145 family)
MKKVISFLFATLAFQISFSQTVQLEIKVLIEGPYYNGQMTPFLNVLGHLPTSQPYNTTPWEYAGTESVTSLPSSNIVDWVLVDILKPHNDGNQIRFEVMGRKAGFLFKDGFIKDIDGTSNLTIETKMMSGFHIRIHHRNHLSVISAIPLVESGGVFTYDFTPSADQALGGTFSLKQLSPVIWGMIAADANASGQIDNRDKNDVWFPQNGLTGYYDGDFNMDTQVDNDDKVVKWKPNAGKCSYPVRDTILPLFICGSSVVMFNGLEYGTIKYNDKCWLDRNLGANQVATAYNDPLSYGELFQWGRLIDGHQLRNSTTTNFLSSADIPGHGDFIITDDDPYDWRNPQNNNLWQETTNINNPCPDGWNVPSLTQWQEAATGWTNRTDAFNSLLKLPSAGWRSESAGNISNAGSWGNYWTTSVNSTGARGIYFDSFNFNSNTYARASGRSVRCLKTDYVPNNPPAEPSDPYPTNGATGVETNINLSWVCSDPDGDNLTYNIYFGTTEIPPLVIINNTDTTWNPGLLNLNTIYYWKIVAYDIYGDSTQGVVWNFITKIPFDCGDILVDDRDGQSYNTVQIGDQCWMSENLNVGTMINGSANQTNNSTIEKYCYDNNTSNCDTYGGLYQWNEMMQYSATPGVQGICPSGWHVPTDEEWCTVTQFVDPTVDCYIWGQSGTDIGIKMKSTYGWINGGNGLNSSGFNALPGGHRTSNFEDQGENAYFWSSTDYDEIIYYRSLDFSNSFLNRDLTFVILGLSVRCLKDDESPTWSCGDPLNDTRDGQTYNTVQIGEQCWMAENLNIGTMVQGTTAMTDNSIIEKYCYDNNTSDCDTYGGLYQWNEMMEYTTQEGAQGICPTGWHIPTDSEYCTLTQYIDPTVNCGVHEWSGTDAGIKMKSTTGWNTGGINTNTSGFTALPAGFRYVDGLFHNEFDNALFWSSTDSTSNHGWSREFHYFYDNILRDFNNKNMGLSLRCVKGNAPPTWSCGDPLNDTRDGQTYNTVQIGEQCWMAENLNIGTMINGISNQTDNSSIEKYCYNNNNSNCDTYGGLYQWNEMMEYSDQEEQQGICPNGWHTPSDNEWKVLEGAVDSQFGVGDPQWDNTGWRGLDVGLLLKSLIGWSLNGNGTDQFGFNITPSGHRGTNGSFVALGDNAYYWQSTEYSGADAWKRAFDYIENKISRDEYNKNAGYSVRCIKDASPSTWSCGDPLNDTRDGQTYNTIQIGDQCWMAENLNVGTMIQGTTEMTNNSIIEKYCFNNSIANCDVYGGLYKWNEMMEYSTSPGVQGICPINWHLPTYEEWTLLTSFLGDVGIAGGKMKATGTIEAGTGLWFAPNAGATNSSGFTALPGDRYNGSFNNLGGYASFWSSSEVDMNNAWDQLLYYIYSETFRNTDFKGYGFSVRCVKNN